MECQFFSHMPLTNSPRDIHLIEVFLVDLFAKRHSTHCVMANSKNPQPIPNFCAHNTEIFRLSLLTRCFNSNMNDTNTYEQVNDLHDVSVNTNGPHNLICVLFT